MGKREKGGSPSCGAKSNKPQHKARRLLALGPGLRSSCKERPCSCPTLSPLAGRPLPARIQMEAPPSPPVGMRRYGNCRHFALSGMGGEAGPKGEEVTERPLGSVCTFGDTRGSVVGAEGSHVWGAGRGFLCGRESGRLANWGTLVRMGRACFSWSPKGVLAGEEDKEGMPGFWAGKFLGFGGLWRDHSRL